MILVGLAGIFTGLNVFYVTSHEASRHKNLSPLKPCFVQSDRSMDHNETCASAALTRQGRYRVWTAVKIRVEDPLFIRHFKIFASTVSPVQKNGRQFASAVREFFSCGNQDVPLYLFNRTLRL
jgi:hypothetical protein